MSAVAELFVSIGADLTGLMSGLGRARNEVTGFGGGMQRAGQQVRQFGQGLTVAMAPVALGFGAGIQAAADFEGVLSQLEMFGGLTGEELQTVSDLALQLGADTMFSASDAANAMLELAKSGMSVETAMGVARQAMDLAAIGEMDMATAAGIVSTTIAQFQLDPLTDAGLVTEALARAASASRADVADLAMALGNVGPVANQFGLGLDETAAALAVFANAGISGAEAGTQLRSMLLNMTRDTPEVQRAWAELGVSFYDAEGAARPLDAIIDDLGAALAGMPLEDQNRLLADIGGSYGIVGLQALIAAGGIDQMQVAMGEAPGASELAAGAMETFAGRVDALKGSVETLMITALTPFMENTLKPLVDEVTRVVNSVTEWAKENPQLASTIAGIVGALIVAGPIIAGVGFVLSGIGAAATATSGAIGLLLSPIVLATAAIAGILIAGGQLDDLLSDWQIQVDAFAGGWERVRTGFELFQAGDTAGGLSAIGDGLVEMGAALGGIPVTLVENLAIAVGNILGIDVEGGMAAWGGVRDNLIAIFDAIKGNIETSLQPAINTISNALSMMWTVIAPHMEALKTGLQEAFAWIDTNVLAPIRGTIDGIASAFSGVAQALGISVPAVPVVAGDDPNTTGRGAFGAPANATPVVPAPGIPQFASGGLMPYTGYAFLHAGERVLNPAETAAYGSGGGNTYVINAHGRSPHELAEDIERAMRNRGR